MKIAQARTEVAKLDTPDASAKTKAFIRDTLALFNVFDKDDFQRRVSRHGHKAVKPGAKRSTNAKGAKISA
jgi:hypothetical protein